MNPYISSDDEDPEVENFSIHANQARVLMLFSNAWISIPQSEVQVFYEWLGVWLRMRGDRSGETRCKALEPDGVTRCTLVEHPVSVGHYFEPDPPQKTSSPGAA